MLTIMEYLEEVLEEFKERCDKGTQDMHKLSLKSLQKNSPRLRPGEPSIYDDPAWQELYLLKYAYAYGFEYLSVCNEFINDFADKDEISVVSLGCGTMLDYWALSYMLEEKEISRPAVRYLGIDAVKWGHSLETAARDKDKIKFSQESFSDFFKRQDNGFNDYDVYFFPKSISEFSDEEDGMSDMKLLLGHLSEMKKDTIYFCISLRKKNEISNDDIGKAKKIIDRLEEEKTGFRVKNVICITDTEKTKEKVRKGLCMEGDDRFEKRLLDEKRKKADSEKNIWNTPVAENIGGYPELSEDNPIISYVNELNKKCVYNSQKKDKPCEGCEYNSCKINRERAMKKAKYICDLIITFERR